ncbi:unnamed protein product [Brassica oleracea var. botrytis]
MRKNSKLCSLRFDLHEEEFAVKEIDNQVEISNLVCNGLLLCVNVKRYDIQSLMVWNPYLGQTRTLDLDVTPDWGFEYLPYSTSLKGNTYFVDYDRFDETTNNYFISFDFTRERFGEYLQLPWSHDSSYYKSTPISSFGEEKLSALYMGGHISGIGIWVTTKIEPNEVLWSNFLKIDLEAIPCFTAHSFFIDEDTKRAVLFSVDWHDSLKTEEE